MKIRSILICLLCAYLLCSCNKPDEVTLIDVSSIDVSSNTYASEICSDISKTAEHTLADYTADESLIKKYKSASDKITKNINTEKYADSKQLNTILELKNEHSFDEAMNLLNYFRDTTKGYNWYKKIPLTTDNEENGKSDAEAFERLGSFVCYDDGFAAESSAQVHLLACNKSNLWFHWEYLYLSPKLSSLCEKTFDNVPSEEDFIFATKAFFITYLPEYFSEDAIIRIIETTDKSTSVCVEFPSIKLDPDNPNLVYSPLAATLHFGWYEDDIELAGGNEKAVLRQLTLEYPSEFKELKTVTKNVLSADAAWKNVIGGDYFESTYGEENILSFESGDIFVHDYYIDYHNYDDTYQPCYTFICSAKDGGTLFCIVTSAT